MGDGKNLKKLLSRFGLSVKGLADKMSVPPTTLYSIISRDSDISLTMIDKIARALDVTWFEVYEFFSNDAKFPTPGDIDGLLASEGYEQIINYKGIDGFWGLRGHGKVYQLEYDDYADLHAYTLDAFRKKLYEILDNDSIAVYDDEKE